MFQQTVDPEAALIRALVVPEKRRRLTESLASPKRRQKALHTLPHFRHFDPRFVIPIAPSEQYAERIAELLQQRGAPADCYVISAGKLDQRTLRLLEALQSIVGFEPGTLISCIPGRLGYFEGEELNHRLLLERVAL